MPEMNVAEVLTLAAKHAENGAAMITSAQLCLSEGLRWYTAHRYDLARANAIRSLKYSVGIMHADYQRAIARDEIEYLESIDTGFYGDQGD